MTCQINQTLSEIGEPRKYHWSRLLGFSVADLIAHLESRFTEGMNWDGFLKGDIQIDHDSPQSWHPYTSSKDANFKFCWRLQNLQPLFSFDNKSKGARYAGGAQKKS